MFTQTYAGSRKRRRTLTRAADSIAHLSLRALHAAPLVYLVYPRQQLIKFTADIGNQYYAKQLGEKKDYCIYTDTDSTFFSSLPLIENRYPNIDTTDEQLMAEKTIEIASELQSHINKMYDTLLFS